MKSQVEHSADSMRISSVRPQHASQANAPP